MERAIEYIRQEKNNRVLKTDSRGGLFECLSQHVFQIPFEDFQTRFKSFMERKEEKYMIISILPILDNTGNVPARAEGEKEDDFKTRLAQCYDNIIDTCSDIKPYSNFLHVYVFAIATFIARPIYVLQQDEAGELSWWYFPCLYSHTFKAFKDVPNYTPIGCITLFFSDGDCYMIDSSRSNDVEPKSYGLIGMYKEQAEGILLRDGIIKRSVQLMTDHIRRPEVKARLPYALSMEMITQCKNYYWLEVTSEMIDSTANPRVSTALSHTPDKHEFVETLLTDGRLMECLYKVSLNHKEGFRIWESMDIKEGFLADDFQKKLLQLENTVKELESIAQDCIKICKETSKALSERRDKVNKSVIGGSSAGIIGGGMAIAGLILTPFTLGTSLGLTIAGSILGAAGGITGGVARAVEGVKQNTNIDEVKEMIERDIAEKENNMIRRLDAIEIMIETNFKTRGKHSVEGPGRNKRGFLAIGSGFRSLHGVAGIALAAARVGATGAIIAASVLGPLSLALDIGLFAEAAYSLRKGNKTGAGELLEQNARVIEMKMNFFNCELRGNSPSLEWIVH